MSYAPEVIADNTGKFYGNALRFATREEAEAQVKDLSYRWFAVRETRVVESSDPVNYAWVNGQLEAVTGEQGALDAVPVRKEGVQS